MSGEHLAELWQKIVKLEAECELTKRWLDQIAADRGHCSPEALAATHRLRELREQLDEMDERYSAFLKSGSWHWD